MSLGDGLFDLNFEGVMSTVLAQAGLMIAPVFADNAELFSGVSGNSRRLEGVSG